MPRFTLISKPVDIAAIEQILRNRVLNNRREVDNNEAGRSKLQVFAPLCLSLLNDEDEYEKDDRSEKDRTVPIPSMLSLWPRLSFLEDDGGEYRRLAMNPADLADLHRTTYKATLKPIYEACESESCEAYHVMLFFAQLATSTAATHKCHPLAMLAAGGGYDDVLLPRIGEYVGATYKGNGELVSVIEARYVSFRLTAKIGRAHV